MSASALSTIACMRSLPASNLRAAASENGITYSGVFCSLDSHNGRHRGANCEAWIEKTRFGPVLLYVTNLS